MYRLWLWPLVIVGIGLSSWAMVALALPKWLFVVPLTLVGAAVKLDLRLCGRDERQTDTVLKNVSGRNYVQRCPGLCKWLLVGVEKPHAWQSQNQVF